MINPVKICHCAVDNVVECSSPIAVKNALCISYIIKTASLLLVTVLGYAIVVPCTSLQAVGVFRRMDGPFLCNSRPYYYRHYDSSPGLSSYSSSVFFSSSNNRLRKKKCLSLQMIPWNGAEDLIFSAQSKASDLMSTLSFAEAGPTSLAIIYLAGLLTSFSPCSLGLLPLTLSYISTAAGERNDKSSFLPTLAFAAGLGVVFCAFGLSASFLGGIFGKSSDSFIGKVVLALLSSGVSLAMGLQLLDIINIPLPSFEIGIPGIHDNHKPSSTNNISREVEEDMLEFDDEGNLVSITSTSQLTAAAAAKSNAASLVRTFLLGGSSALVASPCATPVLTSILAFVALSQNAVLGATFLLTYTVRT
jgi:cytochrome c-type biogenesis protein